MLTNVAFFITLLTIPDTDHFFIITRDINETIGRFNLAIKIVNLIFEIAVIFVTAMFWILFLKAKR